MRRALVLVLLLACLRATAGDAALADALARDLAEASALFPRPEGSENERRLLSWIGSRLDEAGVAHATFDFGSPDLGHSFSACLRAEIPGHSRDTLIVAVPINHPDGAAASADGSAGIALALELLRRARQAPPPLSLRVLFLGAEYGDDPSYPLGTALFLHDFPPDRRVAVVCLQVRSPTTRLALQVGGRGSVSPAWLVTRCAAAAREAGVPVDLRGSQLAVYRLALSDRPSLADPWIAAGYPAIGIADAGSAGPSLAPVAGFLDALLAAGTDGVPEQWDRHYLLVDAGGRTIIVGEQALVAGVAGSLALMLIWSLAAIGGLKRYLRALGGNIQVLLPILAAAWLLLLTAGLAVEGILDLRRFPSLWTWRPGLFLLAKVAIAAAPLGALGWLVRRLPLPRSGSFWSAAALLLLLVDILVVAAVEVSLAAPFLWAFLCVFAASRARRRLLKLAWFLPSAIGIAVAAAGAVSFPALPLVGFLLFSRVWGNLLVAVVALPFLLFLVRLVLLFTRRRGRNALVAAAAALPTAGAALLAAFLATWSPYGPASPRPVTVQQTVDAVTGIDRLELSSPVPLGAIEVGDAGGTRRLSLGDRQAVIDLAPAVVPVTVEQRSEVSLGRRTVSLTVRFPSGTRRIGARLESPVDFVLYDCSFPFVREDVGRYQLLIGAFPPEPLELEITVAEEASCTLGLTLELDAPLLGAEVTVPGAAVSTRVRLAARFLVPG